MRLIHRQVLNLPERAVHYRVGGAGPVIVLLHQSPQSSAFVVGAMRELIEAGYCVIAPDTPGFGSSDPLSGEPSIAALGAAIVEFLAALDLRDVAISGLHTGALLAVESARVAPERIALVVADGYPLFSDAECESFLRDYLPNNPTTWDGSHLAWLWARMRDQSIFFPWHARDPAHRLVIPLPPPELIHAQLHAALAVGERFAERYGAVWRDGDRAARLTALHAPSVLIYRDDDPLRSHRPRLPALPPSVTAETVPNKAAFAERLRALLDAHRNRLGNGDAAILREPPSKRRLPRHVVRTQAGGVELLIDRDWLSDPHIVINDFGRAHRAVISAAVALNLPGHGHSDPCDFSWCAPPRMAQLLSQAMGRLEVSRYRVTAVGASAAYGLALARADARIRSLTLVNSPPGDAAQRHEFALHNGHLPIDGHGGHLLAHWQRLRDRWLWAPHHAQTPAQIRRDPPPFDLNALSNDLLDALTLGELATPMAAALASIDPDAELKLLSCPVHIADSIQG
jgi:pimeloyl-ACP methyl ester carboxylesterase